MISIRVEIHKHTSTYLHVYRHSDVIFIRRQVGDAETTLIEHTCS